MTDHTSLKEHNPVPEQRASSLCRRAVTFAVLLCAVATLASGQVPPRFYWKTLEGSNGVPLIYQSLSGNANPLDPAHVVAADLDFEAEVVIVGYARIFSLFDRSAMLAVLQPMGRVAVDTTLAGLGMSQRATGFGDPMLEFTLNVVGPPPIKDIPALLRYEPGFSLDLLVDVAFPVGEYDEDSTVNLGQNRWFGRLGAPIVWQLGPWVPGQRTTLELLPSLWLYGDNDDLAGSTLETDPKFQIEGHLTRDLTETFWGSLDTTWVTGGKSTVDGHAGDSLDNLGLGFTLGYQLSESNQLTVGYMASVSDSAPDDLRMDGLRISLVYGWHKIIEGMGRLKDAE
jgi:hypothetical protein